MAWDLILGHPYHPQTLSWKELFPYDEEVFEEYQLSRLHKVVLGIVGQQSLEDTIAIHSDINVVDARGRTTRVGEPRSGGLLLEMTRKALTHC